MRPGGKKRKKYPKGHKMEGTRLTYIRDIEDGKNKNGNIIRRSEFECECGKIIQTNFPYVSSKNITSCGCAQRDAVTKHGMSRTKEYRAWADMHNRCKNSNNKYYNIYGGRGISVCDKWTGEDGFTNFYEDMGPAPDKTSLDRINCDGNYEPSNCRWANLRIQSFNQRKSEHRTTIKTGVSFQRYRKEDGVPMYKAWIRVDGKTKHLVYTDDIELAIFCREEAEIHFYGQKLDH